MTATDNVELIRSDSAQYIAEYFARTNSSKFEDAGTLLESTVEQRDLSLGIRATYLSELSNPDSKELRKTIAEMAKYSRDKFHDCRTEFEVACHDIAASLSQEIVYAAGEQSELEIDGRTYHAFDGGLVEVVYEEATNPVTGGKVKRNAAIIYGDYDKIVNNGLPFPIDMKVSKGGARAADTISLAMLIARLKALDS